ncbi:MAG: NAD(P)-binding protein [Verrucomicrobiota bacterium]
MPPTPKRPALPSPPPGAPPISRRRFIASGTGIATGLAACTPRRRMEGSLQRPGMDAGHRWRDGHAPSAAALEDVDVVVVGGGISGLVAARALCAHGRLKVRLLELCDEPGGNSSGGNIAGIPHPWGAHYVPIPSPEAQDLVALLRELGVVTGIDAAGRPAYRDEYLCHDPEERLFLHGRWQDGLVPNLGLTPRERAETGEFLDRMNVLRDARGADGRRAFAIPVDASSADARWRDLDRETFAVWLSREGFRSTPLRWYIDYCCRDDFGMDASKVSAWAGLHYFASRDGLAANAPSHSVLTWPEGNAWLAGRLREPVAVADALRPGVMATRVEALPGAVQVDGWDVRQSRAVGWKARHVVLAVPTFVAARLMSGNAPVAPPQVQHAPWLVANLWLDRAPDGRGAPLSWDNVWMEGRGLGYVVANHQFLRSNHDGVVITYYLPLDHAEPQAARREAAAWDWGTARDLVLEDLHRVHPGLGGITRRLDVRVWGHGMATPTPGGIWGGGRNVDGRAGERVWLAHTDHGGISIFEEAHAQGLRAARGILHAEGIS